MAAITNATTTTSLTEMVPAETLDPILGVAARAVPIAEMVAGRAMVGKSNVHRLISWSDAEWGETEAAGKTQTDEFTTVEQLAVEATLTAATAGIRKALADEVQLFSPFSIEPGLIMESFLGGLEQFDQDVLSNITSAANTSNFSGLDLTIERWGVALAALRANNGPGQIVAVLHEQGFSDLLASLRASGSGYGHAQGAAMGGLLNAQAKGVHPPLEGIPIFVSTEVPQFDANNWSNAFVRRGMGAANSGLAYGVWKPITFERGRGADGARRMHTELVTSSVYASTLNRDDAVQELVTSKT